MPKGTSLILIIWNVLLTALLGWSLTRKTASGPEVSASSDGDSAKAVVTMPVAMARDTGLLKDARIAYYELDSIRTNYKAIDESWKMWEDERERRQNDLMREQANLETKFEEFQKNQTFMTNAETEAEKQKLSDLDVAIREKAVQAEKDIADLEKKISKKINDEIVAAMEEYNKTAGFDYIISVGVSGNVWPGNKGLNVTADILQVLNARHQASKKK